MLFSINQFFVGIVILLAQTSVTVVKIPYANLFTFTVGSGTHQYRVIVLDLKKLSFRGHLLDQSIGNLFWIKSIPQAVFQVIVIETSTL